MYADQPVACNPLDVPRDTLTERLTKERARLQERVDDLAQATQREARLRELLREAVQCFCVTQKPADYPVDSWINKALTELRRPMARR